TVECFLNAARVHDGPERTDVEEQVVLWLVEGSGDRYVVFNEGHVFCHQGKGRPSRSFSLPVGERSRTVWTDGRKIQLLDARAYGTSGRLVMLGTGGLILTMPGTGAAAASARGSAGVESGVSSNNNNNNNNNNN